jgi:hypothetical protein
LDAGGAKGFAGDVVCFVLASGVVILSGVLGREGPLQLAGSAQPLRLA